MDKKPVNIEIQNAALEKAVFALGKPVIGVAYNINIEDLVEVSDFSETTFRLAFTRRTADNEAFSLEVCFTCSVAIKDLKQLEENEETIRDYAERVKTAIVNQVHFPERASMVITDLTRESVGPFFTPPSITKPQKNA